jgi:hypothetical protein
MFISQVEPSTNRRNADGTEVFVTMLVVSGFVNLIEALSPGVLPNAQLNLARPPTVPLEFVGEIAIKDFAGVNNVAVGAEAYPPPAFINEIDATFPLVVVTSAVAVTVPAVAPPPLNVKG